MRIRGIEFDIDYYELNDLLTEITDEFPELICDTFCIIPVLTLLAVVALV